MAAVLAAVAMLAASCGGSPADSSAQSTNPPTTIVAPITTSSTTSTTAAAPITSEAAPTTVAAAPATTSTTIAAATTTAAPTTTATSTTVPAASDCASVASGLTETTLDAGGAVHDLRIFVPSAYDGVGLLPLVLDWHGYNQSGPQQAALSGFEALAETEGFIVVHPTGVPNPGRTQNGWELDPARDPNRDDVQFAGSLIDELVGTWCADPARVYSTGMSDGGFFTSILVCQLSDRIAAATSIAGVLRPPGCNPSRVVPYQAFHGTDDPIEPFDKDLAAFDEFAADAGCFERKWIDFLAEVVIHQYLHCSSVFYRIVGGGHSWPGSPIADQQPASLGHTTMDIDATAWSWDFFKPLTLDG